MEREQSREIGEEDLQGCVVWTQIPILSWICPAIGHVGICDSDGIVYDFQGDCTVGRNCMIFGQPLQRWKVPCDRDILDTAIEEVRSDFGSVNYSFLCSNCHFFVASVLDRANVRPLACFKDWQTGATLKIILGLIAHGRSRSACSFAMIWIPFVLVFGIIGVCVWLAKRPF